jgi:hypothetical protein
MRADELKFVDVRPEVQARYNEEIQARLGRTLWTTGGRCNSWYMNRNGKIPTPWPGFTFELRKRTRRFDAAAHERVPEERPAPGEGVVASASPVA